jgi:hypothetical protein
MDSFLAPADLARAASLPRAISDVRRMQSLQTLLLPAQNSLKNL